MKQNIPFRSVVTQYDPEEARPLPGFPFGVLHVLTTKSRLGGLDYVCSCGRTFMSMGTAAEHQKAVQPAITRARLNAAASRG